MVKIHTFKLKSLTRNNRSKQWWSMLTIGQNQVGLLWRRTCYQYYFYDCSSSWQISFEIFEPFCVFLWWKYKCSVKRTQYSIDCIEERRRLHWSLPAIVCLYWHRFAMSNYLLIVNIENVGLFGYFLWWKEILDSQLNVLRKATVSHHNSTYFIANSTSL